MPFTIPTMAETWGFLVAVGKGLFPDRNYGQPRSYHSRRARFIAAAVTQIHFQIKTLLDDLLPDTAADNGPIDRHGDLKGVERTAATAAFKNASGLVLGTPGTPVPALQALVHPATGLRFQIANATTVGGAGTVLADIIAVDTGSQTRLAAGTVLQFVSTPAGLSTNVALQLDLDQGGFDREPFGAYRERVLAAWKPRSGGNQADYVAWQLATSGITGAYAYPNRAGDGSVDIIGLHSGTGAARVLTGGDLAALVASVRALAPAPLSSSTGPLRGLTATLDPQPIEIALTPSGLPAHAFDWSGGPLTVLAWTAGTRTLQFNAVRPSTMRAGHRLSLKGVGSAQDGTEYTIEALVSTDSVILAKAPTVAPVATDLAYSGGPLVTPIRNALLGHTNGETVFAGKGGVPLAQSSLDSTVGLEVLATGLGPANPGGKYGPWVGGLLISNLGKIAIYKSGVRNYQMIAPVADYEGTDFAWPSDLQIGLVYASSILVRSV